MNPDKPPLLVSAIDDEPAGVAFSCCVRPRNVSLSSISHQSFAVRDLSSPGDFRVQAPDPIAADVPEFDEPWDASTGLFQHPRTGEIVKVEGAGSASF